MIKKLHLYLRALYGRGSNINCASVYSLFVVFVKFGIVAFLPYMMCSWLFLCIRTGPIIELGLKEITTMLITWIIVAVVVSIVFALIWSLPYERVSNSMIYSKRSQKAYMNINDPSKYRDLDYIVQLDAVRDLVKKEFIEGIQKVATISQGSPIHVTTHGWIVDKVLNSPEVQLLYGDEKTGDKVDRKNKAGERVIAHNILLLISWCNIFRYRNDEDFVKDVLDPRDNYEITLIARHLSSKH